MTPAPRETAAERLARVMNGTIRDDEDNVVWRWVEDGGDDPKRCEEVLRILLSWSVAPAIREAVRAVGAAIEVETFDQGHRLTDEGHGMESALAVFEAALEPLGVWPEEGER